MTQLYSPSDAAPQFLYKLTPFITCFVVKQRLFFYKQIYNSLLAAL